MSTVIVGACAPSPANDSLAAMQNEVARFVLLPDQNEVLAIAGQEIRNAIKRVNTRVWNWGITWFDITSVLDQADYTIANNWKAPLMLERLNSSNQGIGRPFRYYNWKELKARYPNADQSGSPRAYTVINNTDTCSLSLSVPCGQSFVDANPTLRHWYHRRLEELTLPNQRLIAPPEVELFIKWYAKETMAMRFSPALVGMARIERFNVWSDIVNDDLQINTHDWRS